MKAVETYLIEGELASSSLWVFSSSAGAFPYGRAELLVDSREGTSSLQDHPTKSFSKVQSSVWTHCLDLTWTVADIILKCFESNLGEKVAISRATERTLPAISRNA